MKIYLVMLTLKNTIGNLNYQNDKFEITTNNLKILTRSNIRIQYIPGNSIYQVIISKTFSKLNILLSGYYTYIYIHVKL